MFCTIIEEFRVEFATFIEYKTKGNWKIDQMLTVAKVEVAWKSAPPPTIAHSITWTLVPVPVNCIQMCTYIHNEFWLVTQSILILFSISIQARFGFCKHHILLWLALVFTKSSNVSITNDSGKIIDHKDLIKCNSNSQFLLSISLARALSFFLSRSLPLIPRNGQQSESDCCDCKKWAQLISSIYGIINKIIGLISFRFQSSYTHTHTPIIWTIRHHNASG